MNLQTGLDATGLCYWNKAGYITDVPNIIINMKAGRIIAWIMQNIYMDMPINLLTLKWQ